MIARKLDRTPVKVHSLFYLPRAGRAAGAMGEVEDPCPAKLSSAYRLRANEYPMEKPTPANESLILDDREANPLIVEVFPEAVVIFGPQGCSLALTPEAALASAEVLIEAAAEANRL